MRRLTFDDRSIRGLSWTPDGHDLVYSADRAGGQRLWRLAAIGGSPRELPIAGHQAQYPAVAGGGTSGVFRQPVSLRGLARDTGDPEAPADEKPVLRSAGRESSPSYSPDGKRIANVSDSTGTDEIWVSDAEGAIRVQITDHFAERVMRPRWSPDSKSLIFSAATDRGQGVYSVVAEKGAKPNLLVMGASGPNYSGDGSGSISSSAASFGARAPMAATWRRSRANGVGESLSSPRMASTSSTGRAAAFTGSRLQAVRKKNSSSPSTT